MVDERELVGLLRGAARQRVPLEGTLRRWSNRDLARLAMQRALPDGFGHRIYSRPAKGSPTVGEARWWVLDAPDGRHRWEFRSATPAVGVVVHESVRVDDGERTIRLYDDHAVVSRSFRSGLERLLGPAWLLTHDLEAVSEGEVNGRPTVTARAIRRLNRSPSGSPTDMAPERRIVIDMADGFLHSDTAVIDDEPTRRWSYWTSTWAFRSTPTRSRSSSVPICVSSMGPAPDSAGGRSDGHCAG